MQWKHVNFDARRLSVRRSKTPAGWRDPSLNDSCLEALRELHGRADALGFAEPDHFLFLWHGRDKKLNPTRPMTSWRSAWRSLRKAAGLEHVRFHDGRHTALTRLAEKGVPDWVIRAQFGHVSPAMMAVYSHVRRKALDEAAQALEPDGASTPSPAGDEIDVGMLNAVVDDAVESGVTSQVTSQRAPERRNVLEFPKKSGSPRWTIFATGSSNRRDGGHTVYPPIDRHPLTKSNGISELLLPRASTRRLGESSQALRWPHGALLSVVRTTATLKVALDRGK